MGVWVHQQVLRFDVSVANTESVDISKRSEGLVSVQLNQDHGHLLLLLVIMLENPEDSFRHVIHHDVKINFIRFVPLSIKSMTKVDNIGMVQFLHDLQFSVFVPFVLVDLLDGYLFVAVSVYCCLEHDAETSISYYTVGIVGKLLVFAIGTLGLLFDSIVHF